MLARIGRARRAAVRYGPSLALAQHAHGKALGEERCARGLINVDLRASALHHRDRGRVARAHHSRRAYPCSRRHKRRAPLRCAAPRRGWREHVVSLPAPPARADQGQERPPDEPTPRLEPLRRRRNDPSAVGCATDRVRGDTRGDGPSGSRGCAQARGPGMRASRPSPPPPSCRQFLRVEA